VKIISYSSHRCQAHWQNAQCNRITQILPKSLSARPTLTHRLNDITANLKLQNFNRQINGLIGNTMQNISGLGNDMTQSASKIVRSVLTRNCKKQCPPNSAFERYQP